MRIKISVLYIVIFFSASGQSRSAKGWINFGSSHVNKWLQIAPGKMGPNALPVPDMDFALVDSVSNIEVGAHSHSMKGDRAVNSYLSWYWCVVPKRVAVKLWAYPTETFQMDNLVRDERQIYYDDTGWITTPGDLWISTFIQVIKEKKNWPDIVLNYSNKTTTGSSKHARYTDTNANYFYGAFGKSIYPKRGFFDEIRFAALGGFYVWQTNQVELAQDEGPVYEFGIDLTRGNFSWGNEIGGYHGYDAYSFIGVTGDNDPLVFRTRLKKSGERFNWKIEYQAGLHDYHYTTFRFSLAYRFRIVEGKS